MGQPSNLHFRNTALVPCLNRCYDTVAPKRGGSRGSPQIVRGQGVSRDTP